jgi:ribosomal protein S18 acetylase RimI-like enzyme
VVVDAEGVCGYLLSTDDTLVFEAWADAAWWPTLRARYPLPAADPRDAWLVARIHDPEHAAPEIVATHPAHLHVDLMERARGRGVGRHLMDRLLAELRQRAVAGVHLGTDPANANAIGFYEHLGFKVLVRQPDVVWMGLRLDR